jgi:hypothetical protein
MPTGPEHAHVTNTIVNGEITQDYVICRCMIGEDHIDGPQSIDDDEYDDDDGGGSFAGAEEIYDSSGRDEDYDFR